MERYWMAKKALLNIPVIEGALPPDTFTQVVLYADAQRALDAEREKVKGLEDKLRAMYANHPEASCYGAMPKLRAQLTQLQALVRALVGTKSFTINGPDIRTMGGSVLYACSSPMSAERLGALLEYRERTLDATTLYGGEANAANENE